MSTYPGSIDNGATDVEYSPTIERKICAADERFASVNEAIGHLQYNLEQHIAQCANGLAPLADFISSSWAVIDELEARIAQLEAAQPKPTISRWPAAAHPPEGDWAHIPAAEWESICEELEDLRAKWNSVPWDEITRATWQLELGSELRTTLEQWIIANVEQNHAPEEEADNG